MSLHTALHTTALHTTALHTTALHTTALHTTALHTTALHTTALHTTALHTTALHTTALHSTSLHTTALHTTPTPPRCHTLTWLQHTLNVLTEYVILVSSLLFHLTAVYLILLALNSTILFLSLVLWKDATLVTTFGTSFGISLVYFFLCPGLSLLAWYMPLYRAYRWVGLGG